MTKANIFLWYCLAVAVIVAVILWLRLQNHTKTDHAAHAIYLDEAVQHNKELAASDSVIVLLSKSKDSVEHASDSIIKKQDATIRGLTGRRAPIAIIIAADSLEFTRAQLENRDSTIDEQAGMIGNLKGRIAEVNRLENDEDAAQDKKEEEYRRYSWKVVHQRDSVQEVADRAQRKADRNVSVGPHIGGGWTADGRFVPSVGFSAQYTIFRFRIGRKK